MPLPLRWAIYYAAIFAVLLFPGSSDRIWPARISDEAMCSITGADGSANTGILLEQENIKVTVRKQDGVGGDKTQPVEGSDMRIYGVDRRIAEGLCRNHERSATCFRSR